MELLVKRKVKTDNSTVGDFFVNGELFSSSLEDRDRGLMSDMPLTEIQAKKVYGETAIPIGRYKVVKYFSPKHQKDMPLLVDVPGFAGCEFHSGNAPKDVLGCTLLGEYDPDTPDWISNSKATIDKFYTLFFGAIDKGEDVWAVYE